MTPTQSKILGSYNFAVSHCLLPALPQVGETDIDFHILCDHGSETLCHLMPNTKWSDTFQPETADILFAEIVPPSPALTKCYETLVDNGHLVLSLPRRNNCQLQTANAHFEVFDALSKHSFFVEFYRDIAAGTVSLQHTQPTDVLLIVCRRFRASETIQHQQHENIKSDSNNTLNMKELSGYYAYELKPEECMHSAPWFTHCGLACVPSKVPSSRYPQEHKIVEYGTGMFYYQVLYERLIQLLGEFMEIEQFSGNILEIGCGRGGPLYGLAKLLPNAQKLVGVDIIPHHIQFANHHYQHLDERLSFVEGNGVALDEIITTEEFDIVITSGVVFAHHSGPLLPALCHQICKVLRPGGFLVFCEGSHPRKVHRKMSLFLQGSGLNELIRMDSTHDMLQGNKLVLPYMFGGDGTVTKLDQAQAPRTVQEVTRYHQDAVQKAENSEKVYIWSVMKKHAEP